MLPQPPPNAEAPPASQEALRSRCLWRAVWVTGLLSIMILLIGFLFVRWVIRSPRSPDQIEAANNARQLGTALEEFEKRYGTLPGDSSIGEVKAKTGTTLHLGDKTSNDYFRQLLATGCSRDEKMFYAERDGAKRPDNVFSGKRALEKGEVGFAYIEGLPFHGNPTRPIAVAPIIPGTDRFDPNILDGKAVILKMDGSVSYLNIIRSTGLVPMNGMNMLDPKHPVWGSAKWRLVWPE